jgi:hypothetical protein
VFTTSSTAKDVDQSYEELANLFVSKPGNINELEDAIDSFESFFAEWIKLPTNPD